MLPWWSRVQRIVEIWTQARLRSVFLDLWLELSWSIWEWRDAWSRCVHSGWWSHNRRGVEAWYPIQDKCPTWRFYEWKCATKCVSMPTVFWDLTYIVCFYLWSPLTPQLLDASLFLGVFRFSYSQVLLFIEYSIPRTNCTLIYNNYIWIKVLCSPDMIQGDSVCTYENGSKYIGETKQGKKHGQGIFTWASGGKYDGKIIIIIIIINALTFTVT